MREWQAYLEAERFRTSAPEPVYDALSGLGKPKSLSEQNIPDAVIDVLRQREHPLIDLGLARFASNAEKLESMWERGGAIRLALLSNRNAGPVIPRDALAAFLGSCTGVELEATLQNPSIGWLALVLSNDFGLETSRWQQLVAIALGNEVLTYALPHDTWNEFTDSYHHETAMREVWQLYESVEPSEQWAKVLQRAGRVYFSLPIPTAPQPSATPPKATGGGADTALTRHRAYQSEFIQGVQTKWRTPGDGKDETLKPWFWARASVAEAASRRDPELAKICRDHPDTAFRVGFYAGAPVKEDWPLDKFKERDGLEFVDAIIRNRTLYERRNARTQGRVGFLAWDEKRSDDYRQEWLKKRGAELVALNPVKYGGMQTRAETEASKQELQFSAGGCAIATVAPPVIRQSLWNMLGPERQRLLTKSLLFTGISRWLGAAGLAALCLHLGWGWWTLCAEAVFWALTEAALASLEWIASALEAGD